MDAKDLATIDICLATLSIALDASTDELIDCMVGSVINEQEAGEIKAYIAIEDLPTE